MVVGYPSGAFCSCLAELQLLLTLCTAEVAFEGEGRAGACGRGDSGSMAWALCFGKPTLPGYDFANL